MLKQRILHALCEHGEMVSPSSNASSVDGLRKRKRHPKKCRSFRYVINSMILGRARKQLNALYGVKVPRINTRGLSCTEMLCQVKEWMTGALVRRQFKRMGRRERIGGCFSFANLKKMIPQGCRCVCKSTADKWFEERSSPVRDDLPPGFMEFVTKEVRSMFPVGWDHDYVNYMFKNVPKSSQTVGDGMGAQSSREVVADFFDIYCDVISGEKPAPDFPVFSQYKEVPTAGKIRPLTIPPWQYNCLRPFHKLVFDRLKRFRWLLTGDPNRSKFEHAGFKFNGQTLLSGDYKSATDNLDLRVSNLILESILSMSNHVPETVKDLAKKSLHLDVKSDCGLRVHVERGQMMGSLLSFPLLCIYNRLCCKFALGNCPMLINGDDVVAETKRPQRWFDLLPKLGLEPEASKTGLSKTKCEINSTPFLVQRGRIVPAPVFKVRALDNSPRQADLGGQFSSFLKSAGHLKSRGAKVFYRTHYAKIFRALMLGYSPFALGFSDIAASSFFLGPIKKLTMKLCRQFTASFTHSPDADQFSPLKYIRGKLTRDEIHDHSIRCYADVISGTLDKTVLVKKHNKCALSKDWWASVEGKALIPLPPFVPTVKMKMLLPQYSGPVFIYGLLGSMRAFRQKLCASFTSRPSSGKPVHAVTHSFLTNETVLGHWCCGTTEGLPVVSDETSIDFVEE